MAFTNLFTRLSAMDEGVKSPGEAARSLRNETETGSRHSVRKRKTEAEQPGSYNKRRCYRAQAACDVWRDDITACYRVQRSDGVGYTEDRIRDHSNKAGDNNRRKGPNYTTRNKCNANKQQQQQQQGKKMEGPKNHHHRYGRGRRVDGAGRYMSRNGGGVRKPKDAQQDVWEKPTRVMTQEFMDQNALLVDGRLLCKHFLWGRCIKADGCQLEHVQGYNDLIKDACKFYVQGFCTKGESCPYMHKSFPCKFFHRKEKCSQGAECRFSHEPLNEVTERLLDEAVKRDDVVHQLKKAEQESSEPANTDETQVTEADQTPDILIQPVRPNFYNSTNAEKETLCQTEDPSDVMDEAVQPLASDAARPPVPLSTNGNHKEPVCYSVEAMLAPQLFRPLPGFFAAPGSQESTSVPVPPTTSEAPYSVDAVLRSCKPVETSTFTPPPVKTVFYCPKHEEITDPRYVKASVHSRNKANKSQEKMFKPLSSRGVSNTRPDRSLTSGDLKKPCGAMPEKPDVDRSSKTKGDPTPSVNCEGQPCRPKHPPPVKPHLPGLMFDSQLSVQPFSSSSGVTEFKSRAAQTQQHYPTNTSVNRGDLSDGCRKMQKRPFYKLFASPVTETPASVTTAAADKPAQSEPEPEKNSSFLSLFATPLRETAALIPSSQSHTDPPSSPPGRRQSEGNAVNSSDSRQSNVESPLPRQAQSSQRTLSPESLSGPRDENQPTESPACSSESDSPGETSTSSNPSSTSLPKGSSPRGSLKTLFLYLRPYPEDDEPQGGVHTPSESEARDRSSSGRVAVNQQGKKKKKKKEAKRKKEMAPSELHPLFQTPQISSETSGGSTLGRPGRTEPQVTHSGSHSFLFKPLTQHHEARRPTSEDGRRVTGSVTSTPLKDLFKTWDTNVFNAGH